MRCEWNNAVILDLASFGGLSLPSAGLTGGWNQIFFSKSNTYTSSKKSITVFKPP